MKTEKILMLGGMGSGKSSVLAAIYDQAVSLTAGFDLSLTLDRASAKSLLNKLYMVKSDADREIEGPFEMRGVGNAEVQEYSIEIGRKMQEPVLQLTFLDTRGGWMADDPGLLQDLLSQCRAAILAIDAVELCLGRNHVPRDPSLCRNLPDHTRELIVKWLASNPAMPKLLCITPIKTETFLRSRPNFNAADGGRILLERISSEYSRTLESLRADPQRTAVVLTPVQTVGNVVFDSYVGSQNGHYPTELWRQITGDETPHQKPSGYAPLDCDQPLRHILNFFITQHVNAANLSRRKGFWERLLEGVAEMYDLQDVYQSVAQSFLDTFGANSDLVRAVEKFAAGVKRDTPFQILQGKHLLVRDGML